MRKGFCVTNSSCRCARHSSTEDLHPGSRGPASGQQGLSLIEALIAMGVLALSAMMPLSTMATASSVDSDIRQRSIALRAALAKMDSVLSFDYGDDFQTFIDYWSDVNNANFAVTEFTEVGGNPGGASGTVTIDAADPLHSDVTVTVNWIHQGQPRTLVLPAMVTEVSSQ